ncbi:MAG: hypothetical protein ABIP09_07570, partial [Gemmatimonadaceae bacterium]
MVVVRAPLVFHPNQRVGVGVLRCRCHEKRGWLKEEDGPAAAAAPETGVDDVAVNGAERIV